MTRLSELASALCKTSNPLDKLAQLNIDPLVEAFMAKSRRLRTFLAGVPPECEIVIKSLIAIGQAERLFSSDEELIADRVRGLLEELLPVERFYREVGGLVGYHALLVRHLTEQSISAETREVTYHRPRGVELFEETEEVRQLILEGIAALPAMAEIYPVGGAADRLRLQDPETKIPLPAARLQFCGKTLLDWMVEDLQAREYLYFKLFGKQVTVPIAMMTSQEKENHQHILALCEEKKWFGRPASSFAFFCQPAVPTIGRDGNWCLHRPALPGMGSERQVGQEVCKPLMKPGGHGVIWKLAKDEGIFDWLIQIGKKKVIVRQINNPMAGYDYGLLAFIGVGWRGNKQFGFASCPRQVKSAEGINVLIERQADDQKEYCLTNIEYCDFEKYGIDDLPVDPVSCYSQYPSNTNILFGDIAAIVEAVSQCPIPGMIVNLKKMTFQDEQGGVREEELARLESTMQNLADVFVHRSSQPEGEFADQLQAFLTYNHRKKTISAIKKEWVEGGALLETPEGCYWDFYLNAQELLEKKCQFQLPKLVDQRDYLEKGPPYDFSYHPALGPLHHIIAQKVRGGKIAEGSQLHLNIAELDCEDLDLQGRLSITADCPMGHFNSQGKLLYSDRGGRCRLSHVSIINGENVRRSAAACWKRDESFSRGCEIILHGDAEFEAVNVILSGDVRIEVESGFRVIARQEGETVTFHKEKLSQQWHWNYHTDDPFEIILKKCGE
jgi:hypothetical protein